LSFLVSKGGPFLERTNEVMHHKVKEGIYMYINNSSYDKAKVNSETKSYNFADMYHGISNRHLQNSIYLMMLGYVLYILYFIYN
jgi:hypothetical protein